MEDNKLKNVEVPEVEKKTLSIEDEIALQEERKRVLTEIEKNEVVMSPLKIVWNNFKEKKIALLGILIFGFILIISYIVPLFTPDNINDIDATQIFQPPSLAHWFGTDKLGRDYFNRIVTGGKVSLKVGFIATLIATSIGVVIGSVSGYYGGRIDNVLMRFAEIVRSFPFLPLAITLSAALGSRSTSEEKILIIMIILGVLGWTGLARMIRGMILSLREQEFMIAAKALGIKDRNQILRHIIPNVVSIIIVSATLSFAVNILVESGLSYLGFGVTDPGTSWGLLIKDGTASSIIIKNRQWLWMFPGVLILLTVLSVNFIGDGLRDAIDPRNNSR